MNNTETNLLPDANQMPENTEARKLQDKIWDRTFKTILLEHPALFIALVNLVFHKHYKKDTPVTSLNTEAYNKDTSRIIFDTSFIIDGITYHFECQYTDDGCMVFRMFEYDFHIALADAKRTNNFEEFNFPKSCVFYILPKESMPKSLTMKIHFQDGSYDYKVPAVRLFDYPLNEIEKNELYLFLPYEILRHIRNVTTEKNIKQYEAEIYAVYNRIVEILDNAYCTGKITREELLSLTELVKDTANYKLENYPEIKKGVDEMLQNEYEPKWKKKLREISEQVAKQAAEETEKQTIKQETILTLKTMKQIGISETDIRKLAFERNFPSEIVDAILNSNANRTSLETVCK